MALVTPAPDWTEGAITYRQLDYWTRRGWLQPIGSGNPGSGRTRDWSEAERQRARIMGRLVAAGVTPEAAARIVRRRRPIGRHSIAPGLEIIVRP